MATQDDKTQTFEQKAVDYITISAAALEKAAEDARAREAQDREVAELIPRAVEAMRDNQRIDPGQEEKLAAALRDPVKAIELLIKTAEHRNAVELAEEQARLGRPAGNGHAFGNGRGVKQAFVGQRSTTPALSDLQFAAALGIARQN